MSVIDSKRTQQKEYISSYFYPKQRTKQSIPFYVQKKRQLQSKYLNQSEINKIDQEIKVANQQNISNQKINTKFVQEVRIQPIYSRNPLSSFNIKDYALQQNDRIKVVDPTKEFTLQNYYNFINELQRKQETQRIAEKIRQQAQQRLKKQRQRIREAELAKSSNSNAQQQKTIIRGSYKSPFDPTGGLYKIYQQNVTQQLDPHIGYDSQKSRVSTFIKKQLDKSSYQRPPQQYY